MSIARIISYNLFGESVCASAAKISTTQGNALEIFERSGNQEKNQALIEKVLKSGHKSIVEHAVFTIAFENVSVFVEQFFIEKRLASVTVKSRRYVDFSNCGYVIPEGLDGSLLLSFQSYMDMLFETYHFMLENGIPKEDARFLLPYSFHSNFYFTVNARELISIIRTIRSDSYRSIQELQHLADQIVQQIEKLFPSIISEFNNEVLSFQFSGLSTYQDDEKWTEISFIDGNDAGRLELVQYPMCPKQTLETSYSFSHAENSQLPDMNSFLCTNRLRELEQLSYTFIIRDISLSGVTHIVRHRMQSIVVPPIQRLCSNRMIVPLTIYNTPALLKRFQDTTIKAWEMRKEFAKNPVLGRYNYYYALSGNLTSVITTINARELVHFIRLRSCNRAQWEIRNISIRILALLRDSFPELYRYVGPSCYMMDHCPEGRLSCGKMSEVIDFFHNWSNDN